MCELVGKAGRTAKGSDEGGKGRHDRRLYQGIFYDATGVARQLPLDFL
jgi:hypothetical protein